MCHAQSILSFSEPLEEEILRSFILNRSIIYIYVYQLCNSTIATTVGDDTFQINGYIYIYFFFKILTGITALLFPLESWYTLWTVWIGNPLDFIF